MIVTERPARWPLAAGLQQVLPVAVVAAIVGVTATLPILHLAANRLVVGTPIAAMTVFGAKGWLILALCLAGGACSGIAGSRLAAFGALAAFSTALILFAVGTGASAADLVADQPPAARARLASGAWIGLPALSSAIAWAASRTRIAGAGWLILAGLLAGFAALAHAGAFDGLSIMVEYRARAGSLHEALLQHVVLSAAAVLLAAVTCVLLYACRPIRGAAEIAVNGLQVVPAVALLGGLVALVSGVLAAFPGLRSAGLAALGPGPATLAIGAYLLLPFWRGLEAALRAPDPTSLDAAKAIGLNRRQILTGLTLPLGSPNLIGALRVACVQSIGLATLGALVGAGGLGSIVFDGMAQFAPDLILLGALPVIGLSLAVERGLSVIEDGARQRWRG